MKLSAGVAANAAAWAVLIALACAAVAMTAVLGPVGLLILGSLTWLVCTLAELDQDAPTWGVDVFRARMDRPATSEQRAALREERQAFISPLRFCRRCGIALLVAGAAFSLWSAIVPPS